MPKKSIGFITLVFLVGFLSLVFVSQSEAQEQSLTKIADSKYFEIYAFSQSDVYEILKKIDFFSLQPEQILDPQSDNVNRSLSNVIDAVYLETSDILDIHSYNFRGKIKFLPNAQSVESIFSKYSGYRMHERSFYFFDKNTIYISLEDTTLGMLGHEIAHAIISHYFVVPPSTKVQEVLCGYVDYNLKKSSGRLSK
ncbi:MAG: hypothetical protein PHY73_04985 [Candidatus Omnitrophica bacterium]|nr:hypothetical protein [Candidatus Omnitrophota bacterium]